MSVQWDESYKHRHQRKVEDDITLGSLVVFVVVALAVVFAVVGGGR